MGPQMESRKVRRFLEEITKSASVSEGDFRSRIDSMTYPSGYTPEGTRKVNARRSRSTDCSIIDTTLPAARFDGSSLTVSPPLPS